MEIKSTRALFMANLPCRLSLLQRSAFRRNVCGLKQLFSGRVWKGANHFDGSEILPGAGCGVQPSRLSACSKGQSRGPCAVTALFARVARCTALPLAAPSVPSFALAGGNLQALQILSFMVKQ